MMSSTQRKLIYLLNFKGDFMTVVVIIAIWVGIAIIYNLISKKGFIKCFF